MGLREELDIDVAEKGDGEARLTMKAGPRHLNDAGIVHGGAIATLVDCAMGSALASKLNDEAPLTVEAKVNYLEPGREGTLVAIGKVRRRGKRFTVLEAEVFHESSGDQIAFATATFTTVE